jgi:serine/threonine-protein kinase
MLTGKRLFTGETVTDTLASVITTEPNWTRVPVQVRRLLQSCLEKDPRRRLRDIGDVWRLLDAAPQPAPMSRRRLPWMIAAGACLAAAIGRTTEKR